MHRTGRLDEAVPLYEFVLENIEDDVEIHNTLGAAFAQQGRMGDGGGSIQKGAGH